MTVELNTGIVAFLLGEKETVVEDVIEKMCSPDSKSRTKDEEGRKLVKVSEYVYRVVNGEAYRKIRSEDERREYQRVKQAEYRAKKVKRSNGEYTRKPTEPPTYTRKGAALVGNEVELESEA